MSRLAAVERAIADAPAAGLTLVEITQRAGFPDAGPNQVAPLAWWLAHTGRVATSRDCARWRPHTCAARCGTPLDPVLAVQGWAMHPACEFPELAAS